MMLFGKRGRVLQRLLIVEDEPLVAFDNEHFLSDAGYIVVGTVDSAAAAIDLLEREEVDLVLADIRLADGDRGVAVAEAAAGKAIPVLFVTGNCPVDARRLAVGCLAKPYSQRTLTAAISAVEARVAGERPRKVSGLTMFDPAA